MSGTTGTVRSINFLLTSLFQDNQGPSSISPQDMRDFIVTVQALTAPEIPSTVQTANYTLALSDAETVLEINSASPVNVIVPLHASVPFNLGAFIEVLQLGTGQVTLVPVSVGVNLRPSSTLITRAQNCAITMRQRVFDDWVVGGETA